MIERPQIAILLATCNRAHLIEETLKSIVAQTYKNWKCIVVDDYSTDNTAEIVKKYIQTESRIYYYPKIEKYKKGLSGSRNYALDLAQDHSTSFIHFFDDDDIMHPQKLELQILPFLSDENLDFSVCQYVGFSNKEEIDYRIRASDIPIETSNLHDDFLLRKIRINSAGPLFKASLLHDYRFNENLNFGEEWELFARIFFNSKPKYCPINKVLFFYRHHVETITANPNNYYSNSITEVKISKILYDFLDNRKLHTTKSIQYFFRYFLLQFYDKSYLIKLINYLKFSENTFQYFKINFLFGFHKIYLRIIRFLIFKF